MGDFDGATRAFVGLVAAAIPENDGTAILHADDDRPVGVALIDVYRNNVHSVKQSETVKFLLAGQQLFLAQRVTLVKGDVAGDDLSASLLAANDMNIIDTNGLPF